MKMPPLLDDRTTSLALSSRGRKRERERERERERIEHGAEQTATADHRPATVTGRLQSTPESDATTHSTTTTTAPPTTTTATRVAVAQPPVVRQPVAQPQQQQQPHDRRVHKSSHRHGRVIQTQPKSQRHSTELIQKCSG